MWKTLGKLAATVAIETFLGGLLDEAGRALGQKLFPPPDEEEDDEEDNEDENECCGHKSGDKSTKCSKSKRKKTGKRKEKRGVGGKTEGDKNSM
jgi:hypothetical protein